MALQNVLEEMKKIQPFVAEDTDSGPVETLTARRGRKRQAIERMKLLREEYTNELLSSAVFILAVGSERAAFEELATTEGNCMKSSAESFFEDISGRVHPSLYVNRGDSASNLFEVAGRHLEDKARELGMLEYPQMIFKSQYRRAINSSLDLTALLKQAISDQVGGEVVGINAVHALTDTAIEKGHAATVTPIVITSEDQKYSVELIAHLQRLTPRVFLVVAGEAPQQLTSMSGAIVMGEVNSKAIKSALKQIKSNLRK